MVEKEVQTDLTVEQMDKDIKEHEEAIQKEQNKGKESQEQLENRNKELEEKLKEGGLNEIEKKLLEIAETPIGTD
ncbi:29015_t:CDS:2, partial [Racocetra persica]